MLFSGHSGLLQFSLLTWDHCVSTLRFRYQTLEVGDRDIHLRTLRDRQQYLDSDDISRNLGISPASWPLFGVVWESSRVLAELMSDFDIAGKRILEIGCGIGLPSLVLNQRLADVTATDQHPDVESFLRENTRINQSRTIPFIRTGWADEVTDLGLFDLLLGSDILYEQNHPELVAEFIDQHAHPCCEVIVVDPGRRQHARFRRRMVGLGFRHDQTQPLNTLCPGKQFKGRVMHFRRS